MLGAGFCEGLDPALQGLLSVKASTEETGILFALVYMCGLLGDITGGPLMSKLMSIRRSANGASEGYCFLTSSVCFLLGMTRSLNLTMFHQILFGTLAILSLSIRGSLNTERLSV